MTERTRKDIAREGGRVSYLEWDSTHPALHFAHANGFNGEAYNTLLAPLASRFQIFASDLRGHGFTTLPTTPGLSKGWTVYGADLNDYLGRVHPGPLVLAGHSMGAIASLMVAAHHPERVRALVLAEPVLVPPMAFALMRLARLTGMRPPVPDLAVRAERRREIFASFDEAFFAYRGRGAFKSWPEQVLRDYLLGGLISTGNGTEVRLACPPQWEAANFRSSPPGIARLASLVRCPLTIIVGENGTAREREVGVMLRRHRRARLVKVPGASHFLPMERPDIVRDEIERIARRGSV
jgi:pimeloyl-ACP methyl ester carboxylesterase